MRPRTEEGGTPMPAPANIELLVDSADYFRRMKADVETARDSVLAQALSFEGDAVGLAMGDLMLASKAPDRRLVIDSFTRHVVNDRLVWTPRSLLDRDLRAEVRETRRMIGRMRSAGVGVRFSGPAGRFLERLPARNHKKLVAVDDRVAYVGGINFSDHNFLWHDLMLRVEDPGFVRFLREDFEGTWNGRPQAAQWAGPGLVLHSLDGETNEEAFARVFALIDAAKESLFVECPYVNGPFLDRLVAARRRGVSVTVVTPENNNFGLCRDAMIWHAASSGFDVRFYPDRMTHMKALLVDGSVLVVGSANFDVLSYRFQQEFMAIVTDRGVVEDFTKRVVEEDLRRSTPCLHVQGSLAARVTGASLGALDRVSALWRRALPMAAVPAVQERGLPAHDVIPDGFPRRTTLKHFKAVAAIVLAAAPLMAAADDFKPSPSPPERALLTATAEVVSLRMKDGRSLQARIVDQNDERLRIVTAEGVALEIPLASVDRVDTDGEGKKTLRPSDSNCTRLLFSPTGRPLARGEGYFSDHYAVFPGVTYGLTDNLSIGAGMSVIPGVGVNEQLLYVSPRFGKRFTDKVAVSAGLLYAHAGDAGPAGHLGVGFAVATLGRPERSLTIGVGAARTVSEEYYIRQVNGGWQGDFRYEASYTPIVMLGGTARLSPRIALVSENWLFLGKGSRLSEQPFAVGLRFLGDRLTGDVGMVLIGEVVKEGFPVPWLSVTYHFGRGKPGS